MALLPQVIPSASGVLARSGREFLSSGFPQAILEENRQARAAAQFAKQVQQYDTLLGADKNLARIAKSKAQQYPAWRTDPAEFRNLTSSAQGALRSVEAVGSFLNTFENIPEGVKNSFLKSAEVDPKGTLSFVRGLMTSQQGDRFRAPAAPEEVALPALPDNRPEEESVRIAGLPLAQRDAALAALNPELSREGVAKRVVQLNEDKRLARDRTKAEQDEVTKKEAEADVQLVAFKGDGGDMLDREAFVTFLNNTDQTKAQQANALQRYDELDTKTRKETGEKNERRLSTDAMLQSLSQQPQDSGQGGLNRGESPKLVDTSDLDPSSQFNNAAFFTPNSPLRKSLPRAPELEEIGVTTVTDLEGNTEFVPFTRGVDGVIVASFAEPFEPTRYVVMQQDANGNLVPATKTVTDAEGNPQQIEMELSPEQLVKRSRQQMDFLMKDARKEGAFTRLFRGKSPLVREKSEPFAIAGRRLSQLIGTLESAKDKDARMVGLLREAEALLDPIEDRELNRAERKSTKLEPFTSTNKLNRFIAKEYKDKSPAQAAADAARLLSRAQAIQDKYVAFRKGL